ncbi:MAG TPA: MerR family transcriptional regulator [Ktedonobacterales bacterium]|nr:MerR family transcriptional regulator [Ktedonobacterales bacterium]
MAGRAERLGRAALENYSNAPLFNTKAVVRQTGVPAPTLRAWERRYGALAPKRGENDYRLYSERDIAIIRWLREQVENGLSISQAIALLRTMTPPAAPPWNQKQKAPQSAPGAAEPLDDPDVMSVPAEDASLVSLHAGEPVTRLLQQVLQAVTHLDEAEAASLLAQAFALFSVEQVIEQLIEPVLSRIGDEWAIGQLSVTVEHFTTTLLRSQLETLYRSEPAPTSGPLVLVGCAPEEQHEIGALILALLLRRQHAGLRVVYLGQNVEPTHLLESVQTLRPTAVCLSAALREHTKGIADIAQKLAALPPVQRPHLIFGGRAFLADAAPPRPIDGIFLNYSALDSAAKIQELCSTGLAAHSELHPIR